MRTLISGAGIAGPALVRFMAKTPNTHITIVEKSPSLLPHGQNVDIQGTARSLIKKMGLEQEVRRLYTTESGTQFIGPKGHPFALFPVGVEPSLTSTFEILRGDLAKVFYEATKDYSNVDYRFGTTIKEVVTNDDKTIKVELSNGEMQDFDLVVLADGQWSKIRKQCFPPEALSLVDKGMYCVYWTLPRLPSDNNWWNIYHALGSRIVSLRPDPHGTVRACLTRMPCNDAQRKAWHEASMGDRQAQQELVRKEFADAGWQTQRLLDSMDQAPDFYFQACKMIKMSTWSNSRIVLLGDTAHAPTPLTGMGTSMAINGAYVLAGELSKLEDGEHPSKALEAYESAFRPFVEKVQNIPSFIPGVAHPETAWKRWLFQSFLSTVTKIMALPGLKNRFPENNDDDFKLPQYPGFVYDGYSGIVSQQTTPSGSVS